MIIKHLNEWGIFKKGRSPRYKLSDIFVEFFNTIHPELKCYFKTEYDKISINSDILKDTNRRGIE